MLPIIIISIISIIIIIIIVIIIKKGNTNLTLQGISTLIFP